MIEQEAQPRPREALEPADHLHEGLDEPLALAAGELKSTPPLWQPDGLAAGNQLEREQHGDDLEHVGRPTGRQREGRHAEQQHEQERKALLLEQRDEAAECLFLVTPQPAAEVLTDT